jgi:hypothetical protein
MFEKCLPPTDGDAYREPGEDGEHRTTYVWTLKKGAKVANGADVHKRALVRRADMLHRQGLGGGIVSLLLPKTDKAQKRLQRDRDLYQLRRVRPRSIGERGRARDPQMIQAFLLGCLLLKVDLGPAWSAEQFLKWVNAGLENRTSLIYQLAARDFPLLLEHPRSLRWWRNRVTELRKMSR